MSDTCPPARHVCFAEEMSDDWYDSDAEKLKRMMAVVGGGSNPEEGERAEQEALPV